MAAVLFLAWCVSLAPDVPCQGLLAGEREEPLAVFRDADLNAINTRLVGFWDLEVLHEAKAYFLLCIQSYRYHSDLTAYMRK